MYNAIYKSLAMAAVVLLAASCGDSRSDAARELCRQSESEIAAGRHYAAIELLDTLDSRYRDLTEVRRSGMAIRARAMEGIALDSIPLYDARLAAATLAVDSMRPLFEHVDGAPGIDGYYLPKGTDRRAFATTGIQGRVSDDGLFYIAASVAGRSIGLRALELRSGAETCTSADISPARVVTVRGSEAASFSPEEVDVIGRWLTSHRGQVKLVLRGRRSDISQALSARQQKEIVDCYAYAKALQEQRTASIRREKYERMLATARDQIANLTPAPDND